MKHGFLTALFFLVLFDISQAQESKISPKTIVESDGRYFMPYSTGVREKSVNIAPGIARQRPSQVGILKKKLSNCVSLLENDTLFNPLTGIKAVFRQEIHPMDGFDDQVRWIPASLEIDLYTTLAKDSLPFWESSPDAYMIVHLNNPKKLVGNPVINDVYVEPLETGSSSQWTKFDRISASDRILVAKKNHLPLFDPVSREDFILTLINFFQNSIDKAGKHAVLPSSHQATKESELQKFTGELEKIRKYDPKLADRLMQSYIEAGTSPAKPGSGNANRLNNNIVLNTWKEAVRKLKAEMNAMSSLELKSQAWWSDTEDTNVSGLTPPGVIGSRPLVRLNKNLIKKTKLGSSIQLIITEWSIMPGTDLGDISGYNLSLHKILQIAKNEKLSQKIYNLLDM